MISILTLDLFVERPNQQTELLQELLENSEQLRKLKNRLFGHPEFQSPSFKLPKDVHVWMQKRADVFQATSEKFAAEIIRRVDSGEYDADAEGFLRFEKALVKMVEPFDYRDFCDAQKCKWCKLRKHWGMD